MRRFSRSKLHEYEVARRADLDPEPPTPGEVSFDFNERIDPAAADALAAILFGPTDPDHDTTPDPQPDAGDL